MSNQRQSEGAIWKKTIKTKNGDVEVLNVVIGDKRYTAWPNSFKQEGEKSPDYRLQLDTYEAKPKPQAFAPKTQGFSSKSDLPF